MLNKIVLILIVSVSLALAQHKEQKFKMSTNITYNKLNLYGASLTESGIKEEFGDACEVTVSLKPLEPNKQGQMFEVVFTIVYNEVTLSKAAQIEKAIRKHYGDACSITINMERADSGTSAWWSRSNPRYYWNGDTISFRSVPLKATVLTDSLAPYIHSPSLNIGKSK